MKLEDNNLFLSDYTGNNKWDFHKSATEKVSFYYQSSSKTKHKNYSNRMVACAEFLQFSVLNSQDKKLNLSKANFCRVRLCPVCQWRRSLKWRAKLFNKLPSLLSEKNLRFLFLTLTIENCDIYSLGQTLRKMNDAWNRLRLRKEFRKNIKGFIRATEVTKSKDNSAHPHFHCILAVNKSYFRNIVRTEDWARIWGECLNVSYVPIVDIRKIKQSKNGIDTKAIIETLKYTTKIEDLLDDKEWFLALTDQLYKKRFLATGGCFKDLLKEDMGSTEMLDVEEDIEDSLKLIFGWKTDLKKYRKIR